MARRRRVVPGVAREVEAEYVAFRETQLGRSVARVFPTSEPLPDGFPRFVRELPPDVQERFVEARLRDRARWAPKDDWVHRWLESRRHD